MPRVDDYQAAIDLAAQQLQAKDPAQVAELAGVKWTGECLTFDFVNQPVRVDWDPVKATYENGDEIPLTDQVMILHYLVQADGRPISGEWIAYREVSGGENYAPVFYKRATAPLMGAFGHQPELLAPIAQMHAAVPADNGDAAVIVNGFPRVPMMLVVWAGDDEFPAEANILMDKSISGYLDVEDIVWLAGRIVYPLAGAARAKGETK